MERKRRRRGTRDDIGKRARTAPTELMRNRRADIIERRSLSSGTSKFCPGCQVAGRWRDFRPKDEVCDDCLILLWDGEDARHAEEIAKSAPDVEKLRLGVRRWSSDSPAWPHLYGPHHMPSQDFTEINCTIADLVYLLLAPGRFDPRGWQEQQGIRMVPKRLARDGAPPSYEVLAPIGTGDLIERLDMALAETVQNVFNYGTKYGRSLLAQLNEGSITLEDFDASRGKR